MGKREDLQKVIRDAERQISMLESLPDFDAMAEGSIVSLTVKYRASGLVRTYVGIKVGDTWRFTGRSIPRGATSDDLYEWLTGGNRTPIFTAKVAEVDLHRPPVVDIGEELLSSIREFGGSFRGIKPSFKGIRPSCMIPGCDCSGVSHP